MQEQVHPGQTPHQGAGGLPLWALLPRPSKMGLGHSKDGQDGSAAPRCVSQGQSCFQAGWDNQGILTARPREQALFFFWFCQDWDNWSINGNAFLTYFLSD